MIKTENCTVKNKNGVVFLTFPNFEKAGGVKCGFSTRIGGVSTGHRSSMNLSYSNGDDLEAVNQNFRLMCDALEIETSSVVKTHQTHTVNIENVNSPDVDPFCDVDGLITDKKGITLCSSYADCVPLLFYDPCRRVVAASHSGWKGTVGEIGRRTVEKMQKDYGCDPKDILVVIGPSICRDCYEVDGTVETAVKRLSYLDLSSALMPHGEGHWFLDLKEICRQTLVKAGIPNDSILVSDVCTCCQSEVMHSHRATGGKRGNLCAFIALD